jgi:hypothetical protein
LKTVRSYIQNPHFIITAEWELDKHNKNLGICYGIGKRSVLLARYPGLLYDDETVVHNGFEGMEADNISAFLPHHQAAM